jgi:hypothetical protein
VPGTNETLCTACEENISIINALSASLKKKALAFASDFKGGLTIQQVANRYGLPMNRGAWEVEQAIRVVLKEGRNRWGIAF